MKIAISVLLAGCVISPMAMAESCRYSRDINFDVAVAGLERLKLDVGAGYLNVSGAPDSTDIRVRAKACADSQRDLDAVDLLQTRRGNTLDISSQTDQSAGTFSLPGMSYAYIDVDIAIPAGLMIDIEDGSGDLVISAVEGSLQIDDGSGDIDIRRITGDVAVDDGSGDVQIEAVTGRVRVEDGSGSIAIQTVEGDVAIDNDGSGDIRVADVTGDFIAGDTGSGDVDYSGIGGRTQVRD